MPSLGTLEVQIGANTRGLTRGANKAESTLARVGRSASSALGPLTKMSGVLAGVGGGFALMADRSLQATQRLDKLGRQTGISVERIQELEYAARQAGVGQDVLRDGLAEMSQRMGEAEADFKKAGGTVSEMGEGFQAAGIAIDGISKQNPGQVFDQMAGAIANAETEAAALNIAVKTFGDEAGRDMVAMLRDGTGRLEEMANEARRLGLVMSQEVVDGGVEAAKAVDRLKQVLSAQFQRTIAELGPDISEFVDQIASNPQAIREFAGHVRTLAEAMGTLASQTAQAIEYWSTSELEAANEEYQELATRQERLLENIRRLEEEGGGPPQLMQELRAELDRVTERANAAKKEVDRLYAAGERGAGGGGGRDSGGGGGGGQRQQAGVSMGGGASEQENKQNEDFKEKLQRRMDILREHLASRRELEIEDQERRRQTLLDAWAAREIDEKEFRRLIEEAEKKHQDKLTELSRQGMSEREKFQQMSMSAQISTVASGFEQMFSAVRRQNKAMFRVYQAAAIANTAMKTQEAAQNAYTWGSSWGGPPAGAAMAALAVSAGLARVKAISSQSFGGGSGGGAGGVSSSTSGGQSVQNTQEQGGGGPAREANINLQGGDLFSGRQIEQLAQELNEFSGDNGDLRVNVNRSN